MKEEYKNRAVIIDRKLTDEEKKKIIDQFHNSKIKIFSTVEEKLENIPVEILKLSEEDKSMINYRTLDLINDFGEYPVNEKSIVDYLYISNFNFWHYLRFKLYYFVRNSYFGIWLVKKISGRYTELEIYTGNPEWKQYFKNNNKIKFYLTSNSKKNKYNFINIIKYLIFFTVRSVFGFFQLKKIKKINHIIIDHAIKHSIIDQDSLKVKTANHQLEYVFNKMDDSFIILDDKPFPKLKGKSIYFQLDYNLFPKRNTLFEEIILLKGLLSANVRKKVKEYNSELKSKIKNIENLKLSPDQRFIVYFLKSQIGFNKIIIFKYLSFIQFFQRYNNIKSISTIDENSPRIKSIIDAAKNNNVTTFGIQHGFINETHPSYMYSEKDKNRKPFPDFFIVWGEYWKQFLREKGNYPDESLIVAGQIRTDIIPLLLQNKNNNPFGKKVIMYASQLQPDQNLRERAAIDLMEAVKDFPDYLLVIKLHPAEKNEFDYYHRLAKQTGCKNYKIIYQYDLYLLISYSDIVTTCFSTVGIEAIYFGKPLIIIDHLRMNFKNFKNSGVAFQATNKNEIKELIKKFDQKQLTIDRDKCNDYINKYAYKIDGKVAQRIIKSIKSYSNL